MAFFKFRLPGQATGESPSPTPAQSVDAMRRRARHRLIGASILVVLGVLCFPLLFDTQPRPAPANIHIDTPDRAHSKPLVQPVKPPLATDAGLDAKEEVVSEAKPYSSATAATAPASAATPAASEAKPAAAKTPNAVPAKAEAKAEAKAAPKVETKPEAKTDKKADSKAAAKPADTKNSSARFVVQVGAFQDESKVRDVRAKVEKQGLKTYTTPTKDGRTRVRIGPFSSRDDADKVVRKLKQLQLQPQVLTL